ncbi:uncharacterized protein LOC113280216 [Papaver somniferum]|uniref:uncharacterized protein LOC113280216 n=1 Tax=Papaver somniferum TaxID=3469 RepID=UPI000E6FA427|nr:uncharacterized protein LOC113280216 [Papaver somniferum]
MEFYKVAWQVIKTDFMQSLRSLRFTVGIQSRVYFKALGLEKNGLAGLNDDTLVFLDASEEEAENLFLILQIFEAITGLSVNYTKSAVMSIREDNKIQIVAEILKCKIESLPLKYLGMSVGANSRCSAIWESIIEKFQKKLAPWKRKFFTKAGKRLLIKTSLASLPIYYMSIFQMPATVDKKLNQIMRNFLCGSSSEKRKIKWVAWDRACTPKHMGGLGIRNLKLTNKALLAKWSWRFSREKTQLWRRLIQEKMATKSDSLCVKDSSQPQGRGM